MQTMTAVEGMESVAPDDQPVADAPVQPAADSEADRLKAKLAEANKHARAAQQRAKEEERKAVEAQQKLAEIEAQRLAGQGEFKQLWEDAKATNHALQAKITELEKDLETERTSTQTERLRATAIARISDAGARRPEQLLTLIQKDLIEHEGQPAVIRGGVEVPLDQHMATLKLPGSDWEHHFLPTAKKGMGTPTASPGGVPTPGDPQPNPYLPGGNMTYRVMLEATQPELAAALRAEAGVG
jgi:hypothetical protein